MAGTLVVAELVDGKVRKSTLSAIAFAKQVGAVHRLMVLIEQAKLRGAIADLQSSLFETGSFQLRRRAMHSLDRFARRIVWRTSGLAYSFEFI